MKPGARAAAAIEILAEFERSRRPLADLVKDWMHAHRFAGSRDRSEIGDLSFGALRWRASSAYRFGTDDPRAWVLGALRFAFGEPAAQIELICYDDPHAPAPPNEAERAVLAGLTPASRLEAAPDWVRGDYPEWLAPSFFEAFGEAGAEEGAALAAPAPLDLRINRLKINREKALAALAESPKLNVAPAATPFSPDGVRLAWRRGGAFQWASEQSFQKGWFEVQDEGSQLAALYCGAAPNLQVADVCAGGGGKTLALAALMGNTGQIYAFDVDGARLAPLPGRIARAGVRNVQVRTPKKSGAELSDLAGRMDVVLVDAPCSGSGTWRRAPDTKWRLRPNSLAKRRAEQQEALGLAAPLVKLGGVLAYVTCSVLPEENEHTVANFLQVSGEFAAQHNPLPEALAAASHKQMHGVQFTPLKTKCDGFYLARLVKQG